MLVYRLLPRSIESVGHTTAARVRYFSRSRVTSASSNKLQRADPERTVVVLGGGISGLTAAWYLARSAPQKHVVLVEKTSRVGGWVQSDRRQLKPDDAPEQSALLESGPRSIRPAGLSGLAMLDLVRTLDLLPRLILIPKSSPSASNRYIYYPDQLNKLPSKLTQLRKALKLPVMQGVAASARKEFFTPRRDDDLQDESVEDFLIRRFGGDTAIAQNIVSAVLHGIYAGDARKLSVKSVLPFLWETEAEHGSLLRSMLLPPILNPRYRSPSRAGLIRKKQIKQAEEDILAILGTDKNALGITQGLSRASIYSFPDGLQEVTDALETNLEACNNVSLLKDTAVDSIEVGNEGTVRVSTGAGMVEGYHVVSAIPPGALREALGSDDLADDPAFVGVPNVNVGVVNVAIPNLEAGERLLPVEGFGFLIPRTTPNNPDGVLGVVFDSDAIPMQDDPGLVALLNASSDAKPKTSVAVTPTKVTVMLGGAHWNGRDVTTLPSEKELGEAALRTLERFLHMDPELLRAGDTLVVPRLHASCIPQYHIGHNARMQALHKRLSPLESESKWAGKLSVLGAGYAGVSVNDCVYHARRVGDLLSSQHDPILTGLERFADDEEVLRSVGEGE